METHTVWSHGGSAGDVIYQMTPLADLWRAHGVRHELWINGNCHPHWRMPEGKIRALLTLIEVQPYVSRCGIADDYVGVSLDRVFRHDWRYGLNLSDMVHTKLGLPHTSRTAPWLLGIEPLRVAEVVIHRSPRYHVAGFGWRRVLRAYPGAVFVGDDAEHAEFQREFGKVRRHWCATYLELARVIAGAKLFVGNQSSPAAVAQGLRKPMVQETVPRDSWAWNCVWERPQCWHDSRHLPRLADL